MGRLAQDFSHGLKRHTFLQIMSEPSHLNRTVEAWTKMSVDFREPGRRSWASDTITWGIWGIPESELRTFGEIENLRGKKTIELGCGTAYFSAWMAKHGAHPTGIDPTAAQLANARAFQQEFGIEFPLVEGYAEKTPFEDASFDLAFSEYGASIWADPHAWIPEAARILKPGGRLVFLRNHPLSIMCTGPTGPATDRLVRSWFDLYRVEFTPEEPEEFHLPTGPMFRVLRDAGFAVDDIIEIQAPEGATTGFEYILPEWARQWPSEEIWVASKK